MRIHPARWGATSTLSFVPALVSLCMANCFYVLLGTSSLLQFRFAGDFRVANQVANAWFLGVAAAAYTVWILAVARGWITTATGGGFVIAAHGLILRIVVEFPQSMVQITLAEQRPPEPYATVLVLGRALGLAGCVAGLGFVLAAVLAERRLRRAGPGWAITR